MKKLILLLFVSTISFGVSKKEFKAKIKEIYDLNLPAAEEIILIQKVWEELTIYKKIKKEARLNFKDMHVNAIYKGSYTIWCPKSES